MCFILSLLLAGPRFTAILWWLIAPRRWDDAFNSVIVPVLGIVFLPWTTLMFVIVCPFGNIAGPDWWWLAFGVLLDVLPLIGGARTRPTYA
jgi:hypothetical protein